MLPAHTYQPYRVWRGGRLVDGYSRVSVAGVKHLRQQETIGALRAVRDVGFKSRALRGRKRVRDIALSDHPFVDITMVHALEAALAPRLSHRQAACGRLLKAKQY